MDNRDMEKYVSSVSDVQPVIHDTYGGIRWSDSDNQSRVLRDKAILLKVLKKYQAVDGKGPVDEWKLCDLCEMSSNRFELILHLVLRDYDCKVVRFSSGRIGYRL